MDRWQVLYNFWSSFGWDAYQENSVPSDARMPYITYEASVSDFDNVLPLSASLWTRGNSWAAADAKADEIERHIKHMGCPEMDGGRYRVFINGNYATSMGDPDDRLIKRKLLSVNFEFMVY